MGGPEVRGLAAGMAGHRGSGVQRSDQVEEPHPGRQLGVDGRVEVLDAVEAQEGRMARVPVLDAEVGLVDRGFALDGEVDGDGGVVAVAAALLDRAASRPQRVVVTSFEAFEDLEALASKLSGVVDLPCEVIDASRAAVAGECTFGAGRAAGDQLHVGLGSAAGGIVLGGEVQRGATGRSSSPAWVVVDPAGPSHPYGPRGCLAAYADLGAIERHAHSLGITGERPSREGDDVDVLSNLVERARRGCLLSRRVVDDAARAVGVVAGGLLNVLDVCDVVVHCPVAEAWVFGAQTTREATERHGFASIVDGVRWHLASLGDEAVGLGVLALLDDRGHDGAREGVS
ncbi:MAG: ROK family protein [Myxococcota bacterium]|nr:ROK family protein [Myxococcota bacterium]